MVRRRARAQRRASSGSCSPSTATRPSEPSGTPFDASGPGRPGLLQGDVLGEGGGARDRRRASARPAARPRSCRSPTAARAPWTCSCATLGGELRRRRPCRDPLGRPVEAGFALLPDGSAVVEMAQASGLSLVAEAERDAWRGVHPRHRRADRRRRGGGRRARDRDRGRLGHHRRRGGCARGTEGGGPLPESRPAELGRCVLLTSRTSAFEDAPSVYGPQKGADPAMVERLEQRLDELAASFPRDPRGVPMTGAAGGLSGGLWAALGAELVPGAAYVLDAIGFDARMRASAFVVTGEGSTRRADASGQDRRRGGHPLPPGRRALPRHRGPATSWTPSASASSTSPP